MSDSERTRLFQVVGLVVVAVSIAAFAFSARNQPSSAQPNEPASAQAGMGQLDFAVIGDFGSGQPPQRHVANRMCSWREDHPFDLVVTTGDNIYETGAPELFDERFFEPYACLLDNGVKFHAVLGNHDIGTDGGNPELQEPAFGMDGRNYVVRRSGVKFVMVDSNALDREWLRGELMAPSPDRWTIVVFHHPVYSPGDHGNTGGFRPFLPRLFRRAGVDLVLNGHDHLYAVSKPLRRIRYAVTGGGGAGLYGCHPQRVNDVCKAVHHFLYIRAGIDSIKVRAVPAEGPPLDKFSTTGRT